MNPQNVLAQRMGMVGSPRPMLPVQGTAMAPNGPMAPNAPMAPQLPMQGQPRPFLPGQPSQAMPVPGGGMMPMMPNMPNAGMQPGPQNAMASRLGMGRMTY